MAQQGSYGIKEIYRGVIGDVINQVREAFLDEGVDIDVLQQLKRTWESKIQASGAVDLEDRQLVSAPVPQTKQSRQQVFPAPMASSSSASSHQPDPISDNAPGTSSNRIQQSSQKQMLSEQPVAGTQNPIQLLSLPMPSQMLAPGSHMQLPPGVLPGTQYAIVDGPNGTQNLILLNSSQMQLNLETQAQFLLQQQQNSGNNPSAFRRPAPEIATKKEPGTGHVPQIDGGGSSSSSSFQETKKAKKKSGRLMIKKILQLDGGGPGMTDSSSEEEPDDDDDLKRFVGLEDETGDKVDDDEDEPLNSGDDQSDDEDLDTLFDADNVVVCQFEKVHRARNKWKFNLKDGLMQINGNDYCFHKSTGEAEW